MVRKLLHILALGLKELNSIRADPILLALTVYTFSYAVYAVATGAKTEVDHVSTAIVDEDHSELSRLIRQAILPPWFQPPVEIPATEIGPSMDASRYVFVIEIPPKFEQDVISNRYPSLQINMDATAAQFREIASTSSLLLSVHRRTALFSPPIANGIGVGRPACDEALVMTAAVIQFTAGCGTRVASTPAKAELLLASKTTGAVCSRASLATSSATSSSAVPSGNCLMSMTPIALPACGHTPAKTSAEWSCISPTSSPRKNPDAADALQVSGRLGS